MLVSLAPSMPTEAKRHFAAGKTWEQHSIIEGLKVYWSIKSRIQGPRVTLEKLTKPQFLHDKMYTRATLAASCWDSQ